MHICASKLNINGYDNGLSSCRPQAIIWTNIGIRTLGIHFNEVFPIGNVRVDISDAFEDFAYQNIDTAVRTYNSTVADIIDNHAPQKSRIVTVRADKPWYTAELSQEKRLRRKYEWKYKQSKLTVDKLQLQEQRNKYNALLNSTKKDYLKNKIENAESSKALYRICDKRLNREQIAILPSHDCAQSLANTFVNYLNEKIELIRNNLEPSLNSSTDQVPDSVSISCGVSFEQFNVVSEADIRRLLAHHQRNRAPLTRSLHD